MDNEGTVEPKSAEQLRNEIRTAFLDTGVKTRKSKVLNIFGVDVEVKQPTLKQISELQNTTDTSTSVQILIGYCYVPGTDIKVFDKADVDVLENAPSGQWFIDLNDAILEMTGISIKDAEKN